MPKILNIHAAENAPMGELVTYRAMPTRTIDMLDPFLFLNHHGPQVYASNNSGLPFGPHPHRGIETVTFIIDGDICHKDNGGHESVMTAGGVQWMTAGSGLMHEEVSSKEFKKNGGPLEILQLWLNLPSRLRMTKPNYVGLEKESIPMLSVNDGVNIQCISGTWENQEGPFPTITGISLALIHFKNGSSYTLNAPPEHTIFFYTIRGSLTLENTIVKALNLVEFTDEGGEIIIKSNEDSILLLGYGKPYHEPIFSHGPFVMNTKEEIIEAYNDYNAGKFGAWK